MCQNSQIKLSVTEYDTLRQRDWKNTLPFSKAQPERQTRIESLSNFHFDDQSILENNVFRRFGGRHGEARNIKHIRNSYTYTLLLPAA